MSHLSGLKSPGYSEDHLKLVPETKIRGYTNVGTCKS